MPDFSELQNQVLEVLDLDLVMFVDPGLFPHSINLHFCNRRSRNENLTPAI